MTTREHLADLARGIIIDGKDESLILATLGWHPDTFTKYLGLFLKANYATRTEGRLVLTAKGAAFARELENEEREPEAAEVSTRDLGSREHCKNCGADLVGDDVPRCPDAIAGNVSETNFRYCDADRGGKDARAETWDDRRCW